MGSKKFVALLLSLLMLLSMAPISAMATGENVQYTVSADKSSVNAGEKVIVTFGISEVGSGIDGYATMLLQITFPEDLFVYNVATKTSLSGMANVTYGDEEKKWACTLAGDATSNIKATGTILTASFTAKTTAGSGEFGISVLQCHNLNNDSLTTSVTPATVSVNIDPTGISLDKSSLMLTKGGSVGIITASLTPATSNAKVKWGIADGSLFSSIATSTDTKTLTLTPASSSSGTTTVRATVTNASGTDFSASCTVTVSPGENSASLSISPTSAAKVGDTLTATVTNLSSNTDAIAYQWYRVIGGNSAAISGATSNTYTVVAADVGNSVTVKASITNAASIPYSNNPLTTGNVAISKASQTAPTVTASNVAAEQVTLSATGSSAVGTVEYAYATGSSVASPVSATQSNANITGLKEHTAYTFFARYAGDASTEASPWGSVNAITLFESRTVTVAKSPNASQIAVGASTTTNVHTGDSVTVTTTNASPSNYIFKEWKEADNYVATSSNETYTFTMPAKNVSLTAYYYIVEPTPAAPTGTGTLTNDHKPAIKYTAQSDLMYAVTTSTSAPAYDSALWEDPADGEVTKQVATHGESYYIHAYKPARDGDHYRSECAISAAITTPHYYAWEFTSESLDFFARLNAGEQPAAQTVTVTNVGTGTLTDVGVTLSGEDAFASTSPATSIAPGATASFTISATGARTSKTVYNATATVAAKQNYGASMASKEIGLTYTVADRIAVHVDVDYAATSVYDGIAKPVAITGFTLPGMVGGMLTTADLAVIYTAGGVTSTNAPKTAGSYTANVIVTGDKAADYAVTSPTNISFEITQRPLTVTGLSVTSKTYNRNAAATIIGTPVLNGKISGDTVTVGSLTAGTFTDALGAESYAVGTGKPVTFTNLTLSGADAANYSLTQPTLTGNITAKAITPVATASDKVYDGNTNATVLVSFSTSDICAGDTVTLTHSGQATFNNKNAGSNKQVTLGTVTVSGTNAGNYDVKISAITAPHATITQLGRSVTLSGTATQVYDGQPADAVTGTYTVATASSDTAAVTVYYKLSGTNAPTITVPTLAGTYAVSASITDANYKLSSTTGVTQLVINAGTLGGSNIDAGVASLQASVVKIPVSGFGITPTVAGTYAVTASTTNNSILKVSPTAPKVVGSNVEFYIIPGATTTNADTISVTFTPSAQNTYAAKTLIINVKRTTESATASFTPYILYVDLGSSVIDACATAGIKFNVKYQAHTTADKSLAPASWSNSPCEYSTNYVATATGTNAIGQKSLRVTYTDAAGNKWSGTMSFTVRDVVTSIVVTSPTNTSYNLGAAALDFTGGSYKKIMKSQIEDTNPTAITQAMCSVNGAPLTKAILNKIGTYTVSVTDAASGKSDTFALTVKSTKQADITATPTNDQPVGVIDAGNATFTDGSNPVSPSNVSLEVTSASNVPQLEAELKTKLGLSALTDVVTMHLTLENSSGQPVNISGKVKVRVPIPVGANASDTFAVAMRDGAGNVTTVVPTKTANGLEFELPANNVDVVISWKPYSGGTGFNYYITYTYEDWLRDQQRPEMAPPSGLEPDVKQSGYDKYVNEVITAYGNQQSNFWEIVRGAVNGASVGTIIRADAKTFDQMPADIMNLVRAKGVTLVIGWAWGKDVTITPNNALVPEAGREYYPLSYLVTALSAATVTTAASLLLVPQTGDELEVLSMTPAVYGMIDGSKPSIGNAAAALDIAVEDAAAARFPYLPVALGALAAALLLAGLALGKRRKKSSR